MDGRTRGGTRVNAPAMIAVAPNGARRTKDDHPALPILPHELAAEARLCRDAGASLIHLHVRDNAGRHSLSPDRYRAAIDAIRDAVGDTLIVQITTESCGIYDRATQMETVRQVRPEAVSLALREIVAVPADEAEAGEFLHWVADANILPQYILYAPDEATRLRALMARRVVPQDRPAVLLVLGRHADGISSDPAGLWAFLNAWQDAGPWSVCAFGPSEIRVAAMALALGGDVRVGFENNLWRPDGALLSTNAEQVGAVAALTRTLGRDPMTAGAARGHFGKDA
jgi:3-keto-5-aminohexanoate cleavage enzyme